MEAFIDFNYEYCISFLVSSFQLHGVNKLMNTPLLFGLLVLYIMLLETQLLANQLPIDIGPYSKIGLRQYTNIDAADVLTKPDF